MSREEETKTRLFQEIIEDLRQNHAETIDKAYAYFWDDQVPDEFLSGTALAMGFMNFEDWLICDYRQADDGTTFVDRCLCSRELNSEERAVLDQARDSVVSLYEVASVSDDGLQLKDILLGGECTLKNDALTRALKPGDLFATRLLHLDDGYVMSGCVYPYRQEDKQKVLAYIDRQFGRYTRNVKQDGTMRDYLKEYGDVFNLIWLNFVQNPSSEE